MVRISDGQDDEPRKGRQEGDLPEGVLPDGLLPEEEGPPGPPGQPANSERVDEADVVGTYLLGALGGVPLDAEPAEAEPPRTKHRTEADTVSLPRAGREPPAPAPAEPAPEPARPEPPPAAPAEAPGPPTIRTEMDDLLRELSDLSSPRRPQPPQAPETPRGTALLSAAEGPAPADVPAAGISFEPDSGPTIPQAGLEPESDQALIGFEADPVGTMGFDLNPDLSAAIAAKLDSIDPEAPHRPAPAAAAHPAPTAPTAPTPATPHPSAEAPWESVIDAALTGQEALEEGPAADGELAAEAAEAAGVGADERSGLFADGEAVEAPVVGDELSAEDVAALEEALNSISGALDEAEPEPAETEPAEAEPAETEPAETEPAETEPAETEPAETEPAEPEAIPAEAEAVGTEPVEAGVPAGVTPAAEPVAAGLGAVSPGEEGPPLADVQPLTGDELAELERAFAAIAVDEPEGPSDEGPPESEPAPEEPVAEEVPLEAVVESEAVEAGSPAAETAEVAPEPAPAAAAGPSAAEGRPASGGGPSAEPREWPGLGKIQSPVLAGFAATAVEDGVPRPPWETESADPDEGAARPGRLARLLAGVGAVDRTAASLKLPLVNAAIIMAYALLLVASGSSALVILGMAAMGIAFSVLGLEWRNLLVALSFVVLSGVAGDVVRRRAEIWRHIVGG